MAEKNSAQTTFESAMERLEAIVDQMESGKLPLEEMLERYEEGTKMVKLCSEKLAAAEKRIEIIARTASGKPAAVEFDPAAAPAPPPAVPSKPPKSPSSAPKSSPSDDISLF